MSIERNLIISILKLTKEGPVLHKLVNSDAHVSSQIGEDLLRKLQTDGLVYWKDNIVEADSLQRLRLAVCAIGLGADIEAISRFLRWQEFEDMAVVAFERNDYDVKQNFRFKHAGRKWEIDVVGYKKPLAVCMDCKHWHRGLYPSALKRIVEEQVQRTAALATALPSLTNKIEVVSWENAKFVPTVLSLALGRFKFYDNVPIVPVLQLQDFLNQLPAYAESFKSFTKP